MAFFRCEECGEVVGYWGCPNCSDEANEECLKCGERRCDCRCWEDEETRYYNQTRGVSE